MLRKINILLFYIIIIPLMFTSNDVFANEEEKYEFNDDILSNEIEDLDTWNQTSKPSFQDRFENTNRRVFAFNKRFDIYPIKPIIKVYREVTLTQKIREKIVNILSNLREPTYIVNSVMYGSGEDFFKSGLRLLINSTIGVGGLFDVANHIGIKQSNLSFTDVMIKKLCMKNGQYLILPILGPSTIRNTTGLVMDRVVLDPLGFIMPFYGIAIRSGLDIIIEKDKYADTMEQIQDVSIDEYAMLRSVYYQSDYTKECDSEGKI